MEGFRELTDNKYFLENLNREKIVKPTEIQTRSFKYILEGENIAILSKTGTGKTLAYLLPLLEKIESEKKDIQIVIIAPTYELLLQINENIKSLTKGTDIRSSIIIGNVSIKRQIEKIKEKPHIITASAGRLIELIKAKKIKLHNVKTIVLDEIDRMVDNNNKSQTESILKSLMKSVQVVSASATVSKDSVNILKSLGFNSRTISIENRKKSSSLITHQYIVCDKRDNLKRIKDLSKTKDFKAIIFFNDSNRMVNLNEKLNYNRIESVYLHGVMKKFERENSIRKFRSSKAKVLVTSDLSARGLDFKNITHVINYTLPKDSKTYLHRTGRTGRAGKSGIALSLVDKMELKRYLKMMKELEIEPVEIRKKKSV
ncbi:MAG: helicase [Candidatus Delongbacteria bacterium]|nr:MAG: helicase [Candidatus Delongbacteria bacterium]